MRLLRLFFKPHFQFLILSVLKCGRFSASVLFTATVFFKASNEPWEEPDTFLDSGPSQRPCVWTCTYVALQAVRKDLKQKLGSGPAERQVTSPQKQTELMCHSSTFKNG